MKYTSSNKESGNVLFLILIAVALFAALSYAVTSSTRSGSGSTDGERSLLGSATLTQYPTALRTALVRMVLNGVAVNRLAFNAPNNFFVGSTERLVFHPDGGGASHQQAPIDVMSSGTPGTWSHNGMLEVPNIGKNGIGGNDLIAFLVDVNESACLKINQQMGILTSGQCGANQYMAGVPIVDVATNTNITDNQTQNTGALPTDDRPDIQCTGGTANAFTGRPTGCFYDPNVISGGAYVFYSVLLER